VLCAISTEALEVYPRGVRTETPELVEFKEEAARIGLREQLDELLQIEKTIEYPAGDNHPHLVWQKQPWTIFAASGRPLPVGEEADAIGRLFTEGSPVLLLFEGGAWRWPTIRVGYQRDVIPGVVLRTVSRQPALFEVKIEDTEDDNQLSIKLLSDVVTIAEKKMRPSVMEGKVDKAVRSSDSAFLPYSSDPQLKKLSLGTAKLLRTDEDNLETLQVLRYTKNQHYDAHRDYWDPREFPNIGRFTGPNGYWRQRHATLLWYLAAPEKGGETWFPRAHGGPIPWNEWTACDERGAKVSPSNATAVLFYSLQADGNIDEYSWHCGCPVKAGVKWAANSWMGNCPRGMRPKARQALPTPMSSEL